MDRPIDVRCAAIALLHRPHNGSGSVNDEKEVVDHMWRDMLILATLHRKRKKDLSFLCWICVVHSLQVVLQRYQTLRLDGNNGRVWFLATQDQETAAAIWVGNQTSEDFILVGWHVRLVPSRDFF